MENKTRLEKRTFHYEGEGWGLTHDDKQLILSDGTPILRFLDPHSFSETKRISVTDEKGHPLSNINELEYIHGELYANVWQTDQIARISPRTGKTLGRIDLSGLMDKSELADPDAVLNGIAYDAKEDRIFVTGKLWRSCSRLRLSIKATRFEGYILCPRGCFHPIQTASLHREPLQTCGFCGCFWFRIEKPA